VIEGTHFRPDTHPARALGHKVLARGLSDIAAMGGRPLYALLSLCLPPWAGRSWQKQFFNGLFNLAERHGVALIGGDLAAGRLLAADIIVLGAVSRGRALRRSGARPSDVLYVSGRLGGSALGLERIGTKDHAVRRHLYPEPRLDLGRRLFRLGATAAMDISDGLSIDLYRLATESRVGAVVHSQDIPLFPGASLEHALHGGEDYELLFTLPPGSKPPPGTTAVGVITARRRLLLDGSPLPLKGFQHDL
jgi:thiamine-monophosphate kinase